MLYYIGKLSHMGGSVRCMFWQIDLDHVVAKAIINTTRGVFVLILLLFSACINHQYFHTKGHDCNKTIIKMILCTQKLLPLKVFHRVVVPNIKKTQSCGINQLLHD